MAELVSARLCRNFMLHLATGYEANVLSFEDLRFCWMRVQRSLDIEDGFCVVDVSGEVVI